MRISHIMFLFNSIYFRFHFNMKFLSGLSLHNAHDPENIRSRICEPFFTTKDPPEGKGMSLAIAYEIIGVHRGKVSVRSEVDLGTTFTIQLPIDQTRRKTTPA